MAVPGGGRHDPDRTRPARHRGASDTLTAPEDDARRRQGARAPSTPPIDATAELPERARERYDVVAEHGRGGIGRVLRAEDRELGRTVAIKELLRHDPLAEARFVREARLTARLEHPSIVTVHEAGRWPDGTPFYAMKLVAGRPLRELIDEAGTTEERLALVPHVVAVADAIAYAHARRIVHRDLKPSNVIAGDFGETVVIDWGLARDLAAAEPAHVASPGHGPAHLTATGAVMGTPAFMAPEQLRGEPGDERTDVYALGALLYTVLAGRPPRGSTAVSTESSRATAAADAHSMPPASLPDDVPGDLAAVALAAMATDPAARLPTAQAFGDELRRFLRGHLVRSRRYTAAERALRWMRRHRELSLALIGAAVAVLAISALAVVRVVDERDRTDAQRRRAEAALGQAEQQREEMILIQARTTATTDPTTSLAWLRAYRGPDRDKAQELAAVAVASGAATFDRQIGAGNAIATGALSFQPPLLVTLERDGSLTGWSRGDDRRPLASGVDTVGIAVSARRREVVFASSGDLIAVDADGHRRTLASLTAPAAALRFDPGGDHLVAAATDGIVTLIDAAGAIRRLPPVPGGAARLAVGPGAATIAVCAPGGRLWLWRDDGPWRSAAPCASHSDELIAISASVVASADGTAIHVVDARTARARPPLQASAPVSVLRFAGDALLVGDLAGGVSEVGLGTGGAPLRQVLAGGAAVTTVAAAGDTLFAGRTDGAVDVLLRRTGAVQHLGGWRMIITSLDVAADGCCALIADTSRAQVIPLLRDRALPTDARASYRAVYAPDGAWLAADSQIGDVLLLERGAESVRHLRGHTAPAVGLQIVDGTLLSGGWDRTVRAWAPPWSAPRTIGVHDSEILRVVDDPSGGGPLSLERSGRVQRLDLATGAARLVHRSTHPPVDMAISPDGAELALLGGDGHLERIDLRSGTVRDERLHQVAGRSVAFSARGDVLASLGADGVLTLRSRDGAVLASMRLGERCGGFVMAATGEIAAACDGTTLVRVQREGDRWTTSRRQLDRDIYTLAYAPDGGTLGVGLLSGVLFVIDTATGGLAARRLGASAVTSVTFAPDGTEIAATTFAPILHLVPRDTLELVPVGVPADWFARRHDSDAIVPSPTARSLP